MILKHQAVSTVQAVPSPDSLTAFGSCTYSKASHVRIHKASPVPVSWAAEETNLTKGRANYPLTHNPFPFSIRCTMKNELLQIKINSLYKTQLEQAFIIKSPNLTSPEVSNFLVQHEEW